MRYRVIVGCLLCASVAWGGEWPQFRGPGGSAQTDGKLPTEWGNDSNVQWKVALPGFGWSSPVVWGDKVFVTTAVTDDQRKPQGMNFGGGGFGKGGFPGKGKDGGPGGKGKGGPPGGFGRGAQPPDKVFRWEVYCLDRATGKTLWKQLALEGKPRVATHGSNTYASETPVTDGERVYAYFGMTGLFCYDLDGKQLWKKDIGAFPMQMGWGTGSSPVLAGDRVVIQCDNEEKSFLVAFDKKTGDELWRTPREERSTWGTPFVWKNKSRTEIVTTGARKVRSYDPENGKLVWELGQAAAGEGGFGRLGGMGGMSRVTATPTAGDDLLYVGLGGAGPMGGGNLYAIQAGASGDLTLKTGETANDGIAWTRQRAAPGMASALVYQGYLYVVEERGGLLSCYDAKTGEPAYARERLNGARGFTSSPWAADGKVYCLDDSGQTFVVQAGPEFKLLGKNALGEMCWSSPAAADGTLLLRTVDHLYCIKQ
jgi:outer membrane protein assembly factor BamB